MISKNGPSLEIFLNAISQMNDPLVSIIISVFGNLLTKKCLSALKHTLSDKLSYEILIVDDSSQDGTVEFLKRLEYPRCF